LISSIIYLLENGCRKQSVWWLQSRGIHEWVIIVLAELPSVVNVVWLAVKYLRWLVNGLHVIRFHAICETENSWSVASIHIHREMIRQIPIQ